MAQSRTFCTWMVCARTFCTWMIDMDGCRGWLARMVGVDGRHANLCVRAPRRRVWARPMRYAGRSI